MRRKPKRKDCTPMCKFIRNRQGHAAKVMPTKLRDTDNRALFQFGWLTMGGFLSRGHMTFTASQLKRWSLDKTIKPLKRRPPEYLQYLDRRSRRRGGDDATA